MRPGKVIELPQNLKRQFYPPLMLLDALSRPTVLKRRRYDDSPREDAYDPEQIFHHFVTCVALLCQVEPNGDAVSSCVVLQEPDKVEYVFTSNHRSQNQLANVAQALRAILEMVPPMEEASDKDDLEIRDKMLRAVLALNWCRVRRYLNSLGQELRYCTASCERKGTERGRSRLLMFLLYMAHHALTNQIENLDLRWARLHYRQTQLPSWPRQQNILVSWKKPMQLRVRYFFCALVAGRCTNFITTLRRPRSVQPRHRSSNQRA